MKRSEYMKKVFDAYNEGRIDAETYDAMIMNMDDFCDEEEDESAE